MSDSIRKLVERGHGEIHRHTDRSVDFREGYVLGLRQAAEIVKQAAERNRYTTIGSVSVLLNHNADIAEVVNEGEGKREPIVPNQPGDEPRVHPGDMSLSS